MQTPHDQPPVSRIINLKQYANRKMKINDRCGCSFIAFHLNTSFDRRKLQESSSHLPIWVAVDYLRTHFIDFFSHGSFSFSLHFKRCLQIFDLGFQPFDVVRHCLYLQEQTVSPQMLDFQLKAFLFTSPFSGFSLNKMATVSCFLGVHS